MRGLLAFMIGLAVLWCGYWYGGKVLIEREGRSFLAAESQGALSLRADDLTVAGFPYRWDTTLVRPTFAAQGGAYGYQADALRLFAMAWKPWHLIAALPARQELRLMGQDLTLEGQDIMASLRLRPASDLAFREARLSASALRLAPVAGFGGAQGLGLEAGAWGAQSLSLAARAQAKTPEALFPYELGLDLREISLPPALLARLSQISDVAVEGLPSTPLPATIERLHLDAVVLLAGQIDRHLTGAEAFAPKAIDLRGLGLSWGALSLSASGQIIPDAAGFASGRVEVVVQNWQVLPQILIGAEVINSRMAPLVVNLLSAMARDGGDANRLTIPLLLKDGQISFGPLPLGAAPRLN